MKRIFFISVILVGSAFIFRYWALSEFDKVFATLDNPTFTKEAVNTASVVEVIETKEEVKSNTPIEVSLSLPENKNTFYMGCTYTLSLEANQPITDITLAVLDAGTRKPLGPVTSGLPKTMSEKDIKEVSWKVGTFWPGEYVIELTQINNSTTSLRSKRLNIEKFQTNRTEAEKQNLCTQSGGIL